MRCINCGAENRDGATFCTECGESLDSITVCPHCKSKISSDTAFCPVCGGKIQQPADVLAAKRTDVSIFEDDPALLKPEEKKNKKGLVAGLILAGVIVLSAIAITVVLVFRKPPVEPEPPVQTPVVTEPEPTPEPQPKPTPEPEVPEEINYNDYIGQWLCGTTSTGQTKVEIKSVSDSLLVFDVSVISAAPANRVASAENLVATCEGRRATFSFADDGWGNSGTGTLVFGKNQVGVVVNLSKAAAGEWSLQTDCIVKHPSEQPAEDIPVQEGVTMPDVKVTASYAYVSAAGGLNLRKAPMQVGAKILLVPDGAEVTLYGKNQDGSWLYVLYGGTVGWVSSEYVRVGEALSVEYTSENVSTLFRPLLLAYASSINGFYGANVDMDKIYKLNGVDEAISCYKVMNATTSAQLDALLRLYLKADLVDGYHIEEHLVEQDNNLYVLVVPRGGYAFDAGSIQLEKKDGADYYISADGYGEEGMYVSTTIFIVQKIDGRYKITGVDSTYQKSNVDSPLQENIVRW